MKRQFLSAALAGAVLCSAAPAQAGGVTVDDDNKLSIGMKAYVNGSTTKTDVNNVTTAKQSGFAVDRFYLWLNYKIDEVWSAKIVTDVNNEQGNTTPGLKRNMNVFLKNAFIQGNFRPELAVWFGLGGTPWIPYEEGFWQHRFVTNTFVDGYKYDDSADYGVGAKGKLADGLFEYNIVAVNGGGYSKPNKSDTLDYNTRLTLHPIDGMDVSFGYRTGFRSTKTLNVAGTRSVLMQGLLSYGNDDGRLTAGYINNRSEAALATTENKGYDFYGWYNFTPEFGLFGRYDTKIQTVTGNTTSEKLKRYILGLDYNYSKALRFSLAYDLSKYTNSGNVLGTETRTTKYGIYSQFVF